jgi:hypothetical protein
MQSTHYRCVDTQILVKQKDPDAVSDTQFNLSLLFQNGEIKSQAYNFSDSVM